MSYPEIVNDLHRQVITFYGVFGTLDTVALNTRLFAEIPFDGVIERVVSYCDEDPQANVTVTLKASAGGSTIVAITHAAGLTAPDKTVKQGSDLALVSVTQGQTLELTLGTAATDAGHVSVTVTIARAKPMS